MSNWQDAERDARFDRWLARIRRREEKPMASQDAPVKTPTPSDEQRERFEWSGEKRLEAAGPILDEVDARQGVTGHNVRYGC
jgi:hypothetical protein